ncbi:MAG: FHA domain-containing protein, partial [Alphaproteobacteria bacterium]|nr:FHA domain-containing protein [Alphaproteobacteria bacterium]
MRIRYHYRGNERLFDQLIETVIIGRPRSGVQVDIDLNPDLRVSRPHARISFADGEYWIEDLNSANGTAVDGKPIKGLGKVRLEAGQKIAISDTIIEVELPEARADLPHGWEIAERTLVDTHDNLLDIAESIDAATPVFGA